MTLELIRSLWRDKPAKHGRHYIFRDGKVIGPHDVWCTDRSHSPSRSVWVYVDGETHKTCTTNGCKVLLAEEVKQFIPLPIAPPPPEGMTEAGPVVVKCKDSNSGRVAHVIATEAYAKLIYGDGESRDTTRRNSLVNVAALCAVLNEHYTIEPSDLAKLPAWVREGIKQ